MQTTIDNPEVISANQTPAFERDRFKTELRLDEFLSDIAETRKTDYAAPWNRVSLGRDPEAGLFTLRMHESLTRDDASLMHEVHAHPIALKQMAQKIAPGFGRYCEWLNQEGRHAQMIEETNRNLGEEQRKALIRTLTNGDGPVARAWLSDKFKPLDDDLVFQQVIPALRPHADRFKVLGGLRSYQKTTFKVVTREPVFDLEMGGKRRQFSLGFIIGNSEIGGGSLTFSAFFSDSYCDNGCIFSKHALADVNYRHTGARIETDFGEVLGDRVIEAQQQAIAGLIGEATTQSLEVRKYDRFADMIQQSATRKMGEAAPADVIREVGKRVKLTDKEVENAITEFHGDERTQFGVQAAITKAAQSCKSADRKIALEQAGGEVLGIPVKQWDSICSALS